jgi:hypothetical protein
MSSRIKGVSLINTIAILGEVLGSNRFQTLVSTCPQETQQLIRRTLVAGEWISVDLWAPFVQAVFEHAFRKDEAQFRRLLRAVCKRDFSTVYRQFVTQTSPEEVLDNAANIWSAYFDSGTLSRVASPEEPPADASSDDAATPRTRIKLQLRDLDTHFPIYSIAMHAYLEQVLSMAGARQVSITRTLVKIREGKLSCDYLIDLGPTLNPLETSSG